MFRSVTNVMKFVTELLKHVIWPFYFRQKRLSEVRHPYTKKEFLEYFRKFGINNEMILEVWDALIQDADFDDFRPYPEDNLLKVFGLADEDLDDLILGILNRCKCRIPPPSETLKIAPVQTVTDLVKFVALMRP